MDDGEYRDVRRAHVWCWVVALAFGALAGAGAHFGVLPKFGTLPAAGLGGFVGLVIGNKLFPDGQRYLTIRAKNYRRARRGRPPLEDIDPRGEYHSDYDRG